MKRLFIILIAMTFVLFPALVHAESTANVYMFRGEGCPHCEEALEYFDSIKDKYDFNLITYEVWYDETNSAMMQEVANALNEQVSGVPYIIIGKQTFNGYAESYNEQIEKAIQEEIKNDNANDVVKNFKGNSGTTAKEEKSGKGSIIIFAVLIVAAIASLIIFGRKTLNEE